MTEKHRLTPPQNWPSNVTYLSEHCKPSPGLSATYAAIFCSKPLDSGSPFDAVNLRSQGWTQIRAITDPSHPACGQYGLFAKRQIPPRTIIVPYLGLVHTEDESDQASDYDLRVMAPDLDDPLNGQKISLGIDATHFGNEARFVNDYRRIAERPNVFFEEYEIASPHSGDISNSRRGLLFKSGSKPIKAGQELLVSYGKGFWQARQTDQEGQDIVQSLPSPALTPSQPQGNQHIQAMLDRQRARLRGIKKID
ncbi:unnamed protein product [Sympodiomycopsis kandeliae]